MKKIILILLLTIFVCLAVAEDMDKLDKEKYMPKKLKYNKLPDNYPKEIDELFEFYYNIITTMDSWNYNKKFNPQKKLEIYIENLNYEKIRKISYLIWLAKNSMPKYYTEFLKINGKIGSTIRTGLFNWNDLYRLSIYPKPYLDNVKNKNGVNLCSIRRINNIIQNSQNIENSILTDSMLLPIWIKVYVIETEKIKIDHPIASPIIYIRCRVLDSFGNKFPFEHINLGIVMFKDKYELKKESEYLMNIGFQIKSTPTRNLSDLKKINIHPQMKFMSQISRIYEVKNNIIKKIKSKKEIYYSSDGYSAANDDILSYYNFMNDGKLYYQELKKRFEELINTLKGENYDTNK